MAAADIVFEATDGSLWGVLADAVLLETHRIAAVATENEVELGVDVTDHYRAERAPLDLQIAISDTPIAPIAMDSEIVHSGVSGGLSGIELKGGKGLKPVTAQVFRPDGPVTRTADSWAILETARDGGWLALIRTRLRTYESMVLIHAETQRTAERGSMLIVDLSFVPIRQVATELVDVAEPVRPRDRATVNMGAQGTEEADPETQERARSLLRTFQIAGGRALRGG